MSCTRILTTLSTFATTILMAQAVPIASFTAGTIVANFTPGQSFTVVAPGPVDHIIFNFFSNVPATTPTAFGTGYLLSSEYLGTPTGLSAATPGFLGSAVAAGGFYTFNATLTLLPATQYFFYADTAGFTSGTASGGYSGGELYASIVPLSNFSKLVTQDATFQVQGTQVQAPEIQASYARMPVMLTALFLLAARPTRKRAKEPVV